MHPMLCGGGARLNLQSPRQSHYFVTLELLVSIWHQPKMLTNHVTRTLMVPASGIYIYRANK